MSINQAEIDLSVLISTRDRADFLANTLAKISQQRQMSRIRWEIIVVDNGSTDHTREVLKKMETSLPLVILFEEIPGKNRALNRALEAARGQLIVFTDDDVEPCPEWLIGLYSASQDWKDFSIFAGPVIPEYPCELQEWVRRLLDENPKLEKIAYTRFLLAQEEGLTEETPCGPNFAVRADKLLSLRFNVKVGPIGKDYPIGGETELLNRLFKMGEKTVYVPSAGVKHMISPEATKKDWVKKRAFKAGRGFLWIDKRGFPPSFSVVLLACFDLIVAFLQYIISILLGKRIHLLASLNFQSCLGWWYEYLNIKFGRTIVRGD